MDLIKKKLKNFRINDDLPNIRHKIITQQQENKEDEKDKDILDIKDVLNMKDLDIYTSVNNKKQECIIEKKETYEKSNLLEKIDNDLYSYIDINKYENNDINQNEYNRNDKCRCYNLSKYNHSFIDSDNCDKCNRLFDNSEKLYILSNFCYESDKKMKDLADKITKLTLLNEKLKQKIYNQTNFIELYSKQKTTSKAILNFIIDNDNY